MSHRATLSSPAALSVMHLTSYLLIVFFIALLNQIGLPTAIAVFLLLAFLVGSYVFAGLFAKSMRLKIFQDAGRGATPFFNGMSISSGVISLFLFAGVGGYFLSSGTDGLAITSGVMIGLIAMIVLLAPAYARSGAITLPEFVVQENGNRVLRAYTLFLVLTCGCALAIVQLEAIAYVSEEYFGIGGITATLVCAATVAFCLVMGGIQSLSIARIIAYPVIVIGFLLPTLWVSVFSLGIPIPHLSYGSLGLEPLVNLNSELVATGFVPETAPTQARELLLAGNASLSWVGFIAVLTTLAAGFAAMPHLLQHFSAVDTGDKARRSAIWAFGLTLVLITAVPAIAVLLRYEIQSKLVGLSVTDLETFADWLFQLNASTSQGVIAICNAITLNGGQLAQACGAEHVVTPDDILVNAGALQLISADIFELPGLIGLLVITGAVAAMWSTLDGLLLSCANTLTQDGYLRLFRPQSPLGVRLFMTRFFLVVFVVALTVVSIVFSAKSQVLFALCISLSAAGLFPALTLRTWLPGIQDNSVLLTMISGSAVTVLIFATGTALSSPEVFGDWLYKMKAPLLGFEFVALGSGLPGMLCAFSVGIASEFYNRRRAADAENAPA